MLDVLERCFSDRYQSWLPKLKEMVPSLGTNCPNEPKLFDEVWDWGTKVLKLESLPTAQPAPLPAESGADISSATVTADDGRAAPQLGQGPRRRDALRTAQAAGRGVRRRTGHPVSRNWTAATCCAETRHFWLEGPDGEVISHAAADGGAPRRARRRSASAGCAPSAPPAATATPPGCCRPRWPRSATTRAASTRRPTWRRCTPARIRPRRRGIPRRRHPARADDAKPDRAPMPGSRDSGLPVQRDRRAGPAAAGAGAVRGAARDRRRADPRREGHREVDGGARAGAVLAAGRRGRRGWSSCRSAPPRTGWSGRWTCRRCCATASTRSRRGCWPARTAACCTSTR